MTQPALNLLRWPQASVWLRLWPAMLSGAWLGAALGLACHVQLPALLQAQAERQRWAAMQAQQQARADAQRQVRAQHEAAERQAQARWLQQWRWHAALSALAGEHGLRVQRWQGDAHQLQLQAWLPQAGGVTEVLMAMNAAGPSTWRLQGLNHGAGAGVWLNLQAPLPNTGSGARTSSAAALPGMPSVSAAPQAPQPSPQTHPHALPGPAQGQP